jgi:hypothetical protein
MDATETAVALGPPIGAVGAAFYFTPQATARAEGIGLDVVSLYAAGRGGVLGDRTPDEVDEEFFFFKSGMIGNVVRSARTLADPEAIVEAHVASATDYALATFGDVDPDVVVAFHEAAAPVIGALPTGSWPLVDGYRQVATPEGPVPRAYLDAVILRELRGGVHRGAVVEAGLTGAVACQFDRGDEYYRLHGFGDADRVEGTPEVLAAREAAEDVTDQRMAGILGDLDCRGHAALVEGADRLLAAVGAPVPVSQAG